MSGSTTRLATALAPALLFTAALGLLALAWNVGRGAITLALLGLGALLALAALMEAVRLVSVARGRAGRRSALLKKLLLATASVALTVIVLELALSAHAQFRRLDDNTNVAPVTLPEEWERLGIQIPGARFAFYWHGELHVHDQDWFRRVEPFPAKNPGRARIIVLGDSLTYGYGVSVNAAYPAVLEERLGRTHSVEVLNLGVPGANSEQVHEIARQQLPRLQPDVVVYGICQNDFIPKDAEQESLDTGLPIPVPEALRRLLVENTRTGRLVQDRGRQLLMRLGLRKDFMDDVLEELEGNRARFATDLAALNGFVAESGLPPLVTLVLDQRPSEGTRSQEVTRIAEEAATDAGALVIPTGDYYREHHGKWMRVSPWEAHPSEEAHGLFADLLAEALREHPAIEPYRLPR